MSWSRRFDTPIKTPDGKTLRTLKDAAEYVLLARRYNTSRTRCGYRNQPTDIVNVLGRLTDSSGFAIKSPAATAKLPNRDGRDGSYSCLLTGQLLHQHLDAAGGGHLGWFYIPNTLGLGRRDDRI